MHVCFESVKIAQSRNAKIQEPIIFIVSSKISTIKYLECENHVSKSFTIGPIRLQLFILILYSTVSATTPEQSVVGYTLRVINFRAARSGRS